MPDLLGIGTNRGYSMTGFGVGVGLAGYQIQSGFFNPTKISSLKAWWSFRDSSTLYQSDGGAAAVADGDPVGKVTDKSGNGNHLIQASGTNKPALKLAIKNSQNVIRFDGTNDDMAVPSSTATFKFLHSQNNTYFVVCKFAALTGTHALLDTANCSGANVGMFFCGRNDGALLVRNTAGGGNYCHSNDSAGSYLNTSGWYILSARNYPADATVANRSYGYKNAGSAFNNNAATATASSANAFGNLTVGRTTASAVLPLNGDIGEIIIFDSALSDADMNRMNLWLNSIWGIY